MSAYTRRNRQTGTLLTVDRADDQGLDDEGGAWVVICEPHCTLINVDTRAAAETVYPLDFCDLCRYIGGQRFGEYIDGIIEGDLAELEASTR
jgi:hypothetical protein